MKLKLDADGHVVLQDGKPVYVGSDGKENAYDLPELHATIRRLNGEAMGRREENERLAAELGNYQKIGKLDEITGLLDHARKFKDKQFLDDGKLEEVRQAAIKSVEEKYSPLQKQLETLQAELYDERVGSRFNTSKFVSENVYLPPDMLRATFGKNFEIKDGKMVAKDANGNLIYSDANPGNPADFDEAIQKMIAAHPHRDRILKSDGQQGSNTGGGDPGGAGTRVVRRSQFASLSPGEQGKIAQAAREGSVKIVD